MGLHPDIYVNISIILAILSNVLYLEVYDLFQTSTQCLLFYQVRHAKNTSLSYPKSSEIFRLKKESKNLATATYASNLKAYLSKLSFHVNMCPQDFKDALDKLSI